MIKTVGTKSCALVAMYYILVLFSPDCNNAWHAMKTFIIAHTRSLELFGLELHITKGCSELLSFTSMMKNL